MMRWSRILDVLSPELFKRPNVEELRRPVERGEFLSS